MLTKTFVCYYSLLTCGWWNKEAVAKISVQSKAVIIKALDSVCNKKKSSLKFHVFILSGRYDRKIADPGDKRWFCDRGLFAQSAAMFTHSAFSSNMVPTTNGEWIFSLGHLPFHNFDWNTLGPVPMLTKMFVCYYSLQTCGWWNKEAVAKVSV